MSETAPEGPAGREADATLLAAWRRGDGAAFSQLVRRYAGLVEGAARRQAGGAAVAQEAAQNVLAALHRRGPEAWMERPGALGAWLHRAAVLESLALVRREARRSHREREWAALQAEPSGAPDDWPDEALARVDEALARLPAGDREVLVLHYHRRQPHREIAAQLGVSEAAARQRSSRALARLGALLRERGAVVPAAALAAGLGGVLAAPGRLTAADLGGGGTRLAAGWGTRAAWELGRTGVRVALGAGLGAAAAVVAQVFWPAVAPATVVAARPVAGNTSAISQPAARPLPNRTTTGPLPLRAQATAAAGGLEAVWKRACSFDMKNPAAALDWAEAQEPGDAQALALLGVAGSWLRAHQPQLERWFEEHPEYATSIAMQKPMLEPLLMMEQLGDTAAVEALKRMEASGLAGKARQLAPAWPAEVLWFTASAGSLGGSVGGAMHDMLAHWPGPDFAQPVAMLLGQKVAASDNRVTSLLSAWGRKDPEALEAWAAGQPDAAVRNTGLAHANYGRALYDPEGTARALAPVVLQGPEAVKNLGHPFHMAMSGWLDRDPLAAADFALQLPPDAPLYFGRRPVEFAVQALVQNAGVAPAQSAEWLAAHPLPDAPRLHRALAWSWAQADLAPAAAWALSLPAGPARDAALLEMVPAAGVRQSPQAAWELAQSLTAPEKRASALAAAAQFMIEADPAAARAAIEAAPLTGGEKAALESLLPATTP